MITTASLFEMVERRRAELGLSQVDVGRRAFGRADNSAVQNLRKGSSPSVESLAAICDALDLELYVGPRRDRGQPIALGLEDPAGPSLPVQGGRSSAGGYLPFPWHDLCRRPENPPVLFRQDWIANSKLDPESLCFVRPDQSMIEPGDTDGLLALVDRNAKSAAGAAGTALWCYRIGSRSVLAMVQQDHRALIVFPQTSGSNADVYVGAERDKLIMLGKVVWLGRHIVAT